jgi:peptidoglycan/LPS O-acetylase OafA/YrhL
MLLVEWKANGLWLLGANALSRLPEFAIGMILGISHLRNRTLVERWLLGPQAVALGFVLYAFAPQFQTGSAYIFADCYSAICCSLVVVGLSGLIEKSVFASKWLSLVGTYSFGLFLTHQPLVTWLGQRIKSMPVWEFLLVSVGVLWLLSAASIALERAVNALTDRLYTARKS